MRKSWIDANNITSLAACQAAYTYGGQWLDELLVYLQGNVDYIRNFLKENLPQVKMMEPDGTYLLWLDFSAFHMDTDSLYKILCQKAGVWMNKGTMFGDEGEGFFRMNIGCPRPILEKAMIRIKNALSTDLS